MVSCLFEFHSKHVSVAMIRLIADRDTGCVFYVGRKGTHGRRVMRQEQGSLWRQKQKEESSQWRQQTGSSEKG